MITCEADNSIKAINYIMDNYTKIKDAKLLEQLFEFINSEEFVNNVWIQNQLKIDNIIIANKLGINT